MTIVADESVEGAVVRALRRAGHIVEYVAEADAGLPDPEVLHLARRRRALLVTGDSDFGELVYRQRLTHEGVLLLRLAGLSNEQKAELSVRILARHEDNLRGAFAVATPKTVRIRSRTPLL